MYTESRIPIISLYGNLIVPIQTAMSDALVRQLGEHLTQRVEAGGVTGLVIDISGIDILDSYISRSIHDIASSAKLMGVRTVMCGLAPSIALTLVEMGMEFEGVETALHLETAMELLATDPHDERDGDTEENQGIWCDD